MSEVITPHFEKLIDRFVASGWFNKLFIIPVNRLFHLCCGNPNPSPMKGRELFGGSGWQGALLEHPLHCTANNFTDGPILGCCKLFELAHHGIRKKDLYLFHASMLLMDCNLVNDNNRTNQDSGFSARTQAGQGWFRRHPIRPGNCQRRNKRRYWLKRKLVNGTGDWPGQRLKPTFDNPAPV